MNRSHKTYHLVTDLVLEAHHDRPSDAMSITMMAKATLVTASRITVEERFSFWSEKIRSAMNFGADILPFQLKLTAKIQTFWETAVIISMTIRAAATA